MPSSVLSSLPPLSSDIPARIAAAAALSVQTLTNTSYSKVSTVNGFSGQFATEPNCYVNALLSWVAPSHRAVLPIDVDATWPKIARGAQLYSYFSLLAGSPAQSSFWEGIADLSTVAAGDVLASPYSSSTIGPGLAAIVSGKPVRLPSSATFTGGAAAALGVAGAYQLWDVPIITALPAASLLASDTRCAGCAFAEGLGNGTLRAYVAGGAALGFEFSPVAGEPPNPLFSPIMFGRARAPSAAQALPTISSLAFCDAAQNQSANLVLSGGFDATDPSRRPSFVYVLGADGTVLREIFIPVGKAYTIACGDVIPGWPGAEILVFRDPADPISNPGALVAINAITGQERSVVAPNTITFMGRARMAVADVDGDGFNDILLSPEAKGSPDEASEPGNFLVFLARPDPADPTLTAVTFGTGLAADCRAKTGLAAGIDISAAPLLQLPTPPLPLAGPWANMSAAAAGNPNVSRVLAVPHTPTEGAPAQVQVWVWNATAKAMVQDPLFRPYTLPAAYRDGARVAALGGKWATGFAVVGSANATFSSLIYLDLAKWAAGADPLVTLPGMPAAVPGPHALASGGALMPPPSAAPTCGGAPAYAGMSAGPMTGAFFVATSGYGAPGTSNLTMLDASRQWKRLRPRLDVADPSFAAAPSGASAVAAASPADNVYLSPYSIATSTDTAAALLFDWNSFPRNDSSAWAGASFFDAATGLPALSGAQGFRSSVWQPLSPSAYSTRPSPCGAEPAYGPAALQFPPVVVGGVTRRTTAAWRRERQIASAWYFAGMGLRYQHSHIPAFTTENDFASTGFAYVSAGRSTPGIDGASFTAWHANFAHGLQLSAASSKQGAQPVGFLFTGTSNGSPARPAVVGGTPTATLAYGVVVASAPITYEALTATLKPGDILYFAGGAGSNITHSAMYVGKSGVNGGVGVGCDFPLVIDSSDAVVAPDDNGLVPPSGPRLRCFRPTEWYFQSFAAAHRWLQDAADVKMYFGGNASAIDNATSVAIAPPVTTPNVLPCTDSTPARGCVSQLPLTFDPRGHGCYPSNAVLSQGACGASYAFSAATVASINLCMAYEALSDHQVLYSQLSPNFMMSVAAALGDRPYPCQGGSVLGNVLQPLAAWQTAAQAAGLSIPIATCRSAAGSQAYTTTGQSATLACAAGCQPYVNSWCQGGGGTAWEKTHPGQCPTKSLSLVSCTPYANGSAIAFSNPGVPALGLDLPSITASNVLALFTPEAALLPVSPRAATSAPAALNWSSADVALTKSYLRGVGAVSVQMSACPAFVNWMAGCAVGSTFQAAANGAPASVCVSQTPVLGYAYSTDVAAYVGNPNPAQAQGVYTGPSCAAGTAPHAATIIGYTVVGGVDAWIVQNSFGAGWGAGGYFYAATVTAGLGSAATGGLGFSYPSTLKLTPRAALPAGGAAAYDLRANTMTPARVNPTLNAFRASGSSGARPIADATAGSVFVPVTSAALMLAAGQQLAAQLTAAGQVTGTSYALSTVWAASSQVLQAGVAYSLSVQVHAASQTPGIGPQAGLYNVSGQLFVPQASASIITAASASISNFGLVAAGQDPVPDSFYDQYMQAKTAAIVLAALLGGLLAVVAVWGMLRLREWTPHGAVKLGSSQGVDVSGGGGVAVMAASVTGLSRAPAANRPTGVVYGEGPRV